MTVERLAEIIEEFMITVPGEDDREWDSVGMAKFLIKRWREASDTRRTQ